MGDVGHADWENILHNFDHNALHASSSGPNHWSDPDMLEIGVPGISSTEEESMFSLWAISAAPLWAGNDLRTMSPETQQILTNREVIAVDQDPLGLPGILALWMGNWQVWMRPLAGLNSPRAVVILNRGLKRAKLNLKWCDLGIYDPVVGRDLWAHQDLGVLKEGYVVEIPSHGVVMLRITPIKK